MGILSKIFKPIKKAFKSIWKGVKKVFKGIMKPISKLLDSSLGKAIMLGVTIFSMGTALMAGVKGFAGTTGNFISKFVQGGKEFIGSLIGKGGNAPGKTAPAAGPQQLGPTKAAAAAMDPGAMVTQGSAGGVMEGINAAADMGKNAVKGASDLVSGGSLAKATSNLSNAMQAGTTAANSGGWLSKAASAGGEFIKGVGKGAIDYLKTPAGGNVAGGLIRGLGDYYTMKDAQEYRDRRAAAFGDPNDRGYQMLQNMDYTVDVPENMGANVAANYNRAVQRPAGAGPTVPFRTPYQQQGG